VVQELNFPTTYANSRYITVSQEPYTGQEQGPLSLASTTEELLGRKSRGSSLEIREYGLRDPSR
jgi:hypothetical protein